MATVRKLSALGATVFVIDKNPVPPEELSDRVRQHGPVDIINPQQLKDALDVIVRSVPRLDGLVCSAGVIAQPCRMDTIDEHAINETINVNLVGTFWTIKLFGAYIQKTSTDGAIVVLSSVDGIIGEPFAPIYSATKAGIISLMKSFARYFAEPLVRVNAVAPGLIDTPLTASTGEAPESTTDLSIIQRMGKPEEVANTISYLLSNEASFITGQVVAVDGGFTLK